MTGTSDRRRSCEMTTPSRAVAFELGINYWPRRRAMYMWREHDLAEVRDEMAQIAALGFDVVRRRGQ